MFQVVGAKNEIMEYKYTKSFFNKRQNWKYLHPASVHENLDVNDIWSIKPEKVITMKPHFTEMHCDTLGGSKYTHIPNIMGNYGLKIEMVSY